MCARRTMRTPGIMISCRRTQGWSGNPSVHWDGDVSRNGRQATVRVQAGQDASFVVLLRDGQIGGRYCHAGGDWGCHDGMWPARSMH